MDNFKPLIIKFESHKVPEFKEVKDKDFVYFGEKNNYPEYLLSLYNRSAKHNAIINSKASYIFGNGFGVNDSFVSVFDKAKLNEVLQGFDSTQKLNEIAKKIILDYEIFGGFAIEIIWSKDKKKIAKLNQVDFSKLRSNKDNTEFYYTSKWYENKNGRIVQNKNPELEEDFKVYKAFDVNNSGGSQLLYYKQYRPSLETYPLPEYLGANVAIETDIEISNYHYNNLKNGFTATVLINFNNGKPKDEEMEVIESQIKEKLTGSDNAGKFIISFADGKDKSAEVTVLSMSDAHEQFAQLRKDTMDEIFVGHRITSPMLMGVRVEGQLGGRSEIIEANELFEASYVEPKRKVFEEIFNELIAVNGLKPFLKLIPKDPIGLDWFGNDKIFSLLTVDEQREKAGLRASVKDASAETLGALNSISPLVANKVIESMTINEMRALVGLNPTTSVSKTTESTNVFNSQNIFSKYGKSKDEFETIYEEPLNFKGYLDLQERELKLRAEKFVEVGGKSIQRSIIDLLSKEPNTPIKDIAKVLNKSEAIIQKEIDVLVSKKILTESKTGYNPTSKGSDIIDEKPATTIDIFLMYDYRKRKEADGNSIKPTTREFCRDILAENKLYDLSEIQQMSSELGYDVFESTGGFWNDNGVIKPHCRHEWVQKVVKKKV